MAGRDQIEEIKQKLDIVQVAEKYVRGMKRSGPNYFALCPFHNEKTPSFSINQDLQIYKCFGCGESGDVISFIQKLEGVEFLKALEMAAGMAGVVLKNDFKSSPGAQKRDAEKKRILEANDLTMKYFNWVLLEHTKGKSARDYCNQRKITKKIINKFQIGVAPKGYENLKHYLLKKGFKEGELVKWGLLVSKNGKVYDKFRERLMFPIFNHVGDVVGFSGRQLVKSDYGPKYLNSPETLVYKKKETMYGLFHARDAIRKANFVVLVEGNVDILSSHRVGVENIVCPLGTALTIEQCKLLKRYADRVYFALDTDEAGEKAMIRGLGLTQQVGLEAYTLDIGKYQDSDELIMSEPEKWPKVVDKPVEVVEFLIKRFEAQFDLDAVKGKSGFLKKIEPFIGELQDDLERGEYVKTIAALVQMDEEEVKKRFQKQKFVEQPNNNSISDLPEEKTSKVSRKLSRKEFLAAVLIQFANDIKLSKELDEIFEKWFIEFIKQIKDGQDFGKLIEGLNKRQQELITELQIIPLEKTDEKNANDTVKSSIKLFLHDKNERNIKNLRLRIKNVEAHGKDASKLVQELQNVLKTAKNT